LYTQSVISSSLVCSLDVPVVFSESLLVSLQELEELNKLLLMKVSGRDRNFKVKMFGCVEVMVFCY